MHNGASKKTRCLTSTQTQKRVFAAGLPQPHLKAMGCSASSCAPIVPDETFLLHMKEDFEPIQPQPNGNAKLPDLGHLWAGATLQLLETQVWQSDFDLPVIKIRVLANKWDESLGVEGWIRLAQTDGEKYYSWRTGRLSFPTSFRTAQAQQWEKVKYNQAHAIPLALSDPSHPVIHIEKPHTHLERLLGNKGSDTVGYLSPSAMVELLDFRLFIGESGRRYLKVRVLTNKWAAEVGEVGWVDGNHTNARPFLQGVVIRLPAVIPRLQIAQESVMTIVSSGPSKHFSATSVATVSYDAIPDLPDEIPTEHIE